MDKFNPAFWQALDTLVSQSQIVIDRSRGSAHPRYPDFVYPLDYGYLSGTTSMDGGGIDLWRGTDPAKLLDAILVSVDLCKRDAEIKLLIGCTDEEKLIVYNFHNQSESMTGILINKSIQ